MVGKICRKGRTVSAIDVKKVFLRFLFWSRFLTFLTFFLFSKRFLFKIRWQSSERQAD